MLAPTPPSLTGIDFETTLYSRAVVLDLSDGTDRHMVLSHHSRLHRVKIVAPDHLGGHHVAIIPDSCWPMRMAAALRLFGTETCLPHDCLHPTAAQRSRLNWMLQALDFLHSTQRQKPNLRQLAETILYPRHDLGRAIEWKCSSQRRQTQRLVNHARSLMNGGYLDLLKGRTAPAVGATIAGAIGRWPDGYAIEQGNLPQYK